MIECDILADMTRLAVVAVAWMGGLVAVGQSPGTFVSTGRMAKTRVAASATLLKSGRVLIAGGYYDNATTLATAELYDPATGIFSPTGNMTVIRAWHTATLLLDGRVLITGGVDGRGLKSAELYDPATGTFTPTGTMNVQHAYHSANLLRDGRVLIDGGGSAELYDPLKGVFTAAGTTSDGSSAVILDNGRVLIANYTDISLYDIKGDSLTLVNTFPGDHSSDQTATLLSNGKVLIAGGWTDYSFDSTADGARLYDPRTGTIEGTGIMLFSRVLHTATLLPGGRVLIVVGYNGEAYDTGIPVLWDGEQYDPSTGSFTSAGTVASIRSAHTATLLQDGTVLLAGGVRYENPPAELYIPKPRAASIASLTGHLAPESLAFLFGARLTSATASADPLSPPTSLGGISLRLIDSAGTTRLAPLLYVSPTQINFVVPAGVATGDLSIEVVNESGKLYQTTARVETVAPALFAYDDNTPIAYALRVEPDGKQTVLYLEDPIVLDERPVYLVLYATGVRNRSSLANVQCIIGGTTLAVDYAGQEGSGIPGLDQVNVRLTSALKGLAVTNLVLNVDGVPSNAVSVDIR